MALRLLTAAVGLPILAGAVWLGTPWLTLLALLAGFVAIREAYRLTPPGVAPLPLLLGTVWVAGLLVAGETASGLANFLTISAGVVAAGAFVAALWFIAFYRSGRYSVGLAYLFLGPFYVGFFLAHSLLLRDLSFGDEIGRNWLLFALLTTFATDTGAFLVGRTYGRRRLAPRISPNKTWEGSAAGFASGVVAAVLVGTALELLIPAWQVIIIGAVVGIVAQLGDLFESSLKRAALVKDASSIIPGHGGILDRLDSLLFALPAVYYLLVTVFEP